MRGPSRRQFLLGGTFAAFAGSVRAAEPAVRLVAETRTIEVARRAATVLGLTDARADKWSFKAGDRFDVRLTNALDELTSLHWHGLTPPAAQDGKPLLGPGAAYDYSFPLRRPGTYWMHANRGMQRQRLLAAPLIVRDPAESGIDEQEVILLLQDFTFRDPDEILAELRLGGDDHPKAEAAAAPETAAMTPVPGPGVAMNALPEPETAPDPNCCTVGAAGGVRLNDVEFDAFLANDRTLADPEIVRIEAGGRVRLRVINAAAATNFVLDLGAQDGRLIAVDGHAVAPLYARRFPLAIGQRLDVRLALPAGAGAWPILAQREGDAARTGIVLSTRGAILRRIGPRAGEDAPALDLSTDRQLAALEPLAARPADRTQVVRLVGEHAFYRWRLDLPQGPLRARAGERIELVFSNATNMAHAMHLHGHVFQVVAIDGRRTSGAMRDTVLVPPATAVTVAFDADNPGEWPLQSHNLYHAASGMMAMLAYAG